VNIDGYVRVSRVNGREGESFISPAVQKEKIKAFAKARGHRIVTWHEELDVSGSKADRPKFQEALERVEAGKTQGIAVAKLDRFARSVSDAAIAIRRINEAGGELISVEDGFDSSTPTGKFAMTIMLALGELELDRIRENWRTAQRKAVERGVHVASRAPTGYVRGEDGRLELVKRDAAAVAEVFRRRATGASWSELAAFLTKKNVVGPYGNPHWTTSAVSKLVGNRAYLGEARSGEHVKTEAHPAIVSDAEWRSAQATRSVAPPRSAEGALLAGLLRCAGCRYVMKPDTMHDRRGETIRNYRCRVEHAAGRCPAPTSVLGRVIEPYVEERFLAALGPGGPLARAEPAARDVEEARRRLEDAERELEAWVTETGVLSLERRLYLRGLEARQEALDKARATLQEVEGEDEAAELNDVELGSLWPELTVTERRRLLSLGLDAIFIRPGRPAGRPFPGLVDRVLLLWRGEGPAELPIRGRTVPLASFPWPDDPPGAVGPAVAEESKEAVLDRPKRRRRHPPRTAH
jgi:DNA invertase Pin-like site-specific DNA recombinase